MSKISGTRDESSFVYCPKDWQKCSRRCISLSTGRSNGITDLEKNNFELIVHFIADTDTDENYFAYIFS